MGANALDTYSLEAYLQLEKDSESKWEYYDGAIQAMAGGTSRHAELAMNLGVSIHNGLRGAGKNCRTYSSDAKISVIRANTRLYPDITVVCGKPEFDSDELRALVNPALIAEVMSESSEVYDRGAKWNAYRQVPSLKTYILINQNIQRAEVFNREAGDEWSYKVYEDIQNDVIPIPCLGISLSLGDIYYEPEEV
jgi:Uma2 family endonuclease